MTRNVETKARVCDLAALRKRVVEVSASGPELLVQRDTFYTVLQGRLKLREFGDGNAELIYYERPDRAGPKTSKYTRAQISDAASTSEVQVDGLGTLVELEVVLTEDGTDSDGERIASVLMEQLGVRQEDLIEQAYV